MFFCLILVSFNDITLRTVLQETISSQTLMIISFVILLVLYGLGYHLLWKWVLKSTTLKRVNYLNLAHSLSCSVTLSSTPHSFKQATRCPT
ncbi:MAG: hypothetical protein V3S80_04350 [Sulfurimonadaceae bacterium]